MTISVLQEQCAINDAVLLNSDSEDVRMLGHRVGDGGPTMATAGDPHTFWSSQPGVHQIFHPVDHVLDLSTTRVFDIGIPEALPIRCGDRKRLHLNWLTHPVRRCIIPAPAAPAKIPVLRELQGLSPMGPHLGNHVQMTTK